MMIYDQPWFLDDLGNSPKVNLKQNEVLASTSEWLDTQKESPQAQKA